MVADLQRSGSVRRRRSQIEMLAKPGAAAGDPGTDRAHGRRTTIQACRLR